MLNVIGGDGTIRTGNGMIRIGVGPLRLRRLLGSARSNGGGRKTGANMILTVISGGIDVLSSRWTVRPMSSRVEP